MLFSMPTVARDRTVVRGARQDRTKHSEAIGAGKMRNGFSEIENRLCTMACGLFK